MSEQLIGHDVVGTGTWAVDPSDSRIEFKVSNAWGLAKVRGGFDRFGGLLEVGPDSIDAQFNIDASSIYTGIKKRDVHLLSEDFFHAERHPEIVLEEASVRTVDGGLVIVGDVVIAGSRVRVELPVRVNAQDGRLALQCSTTVSRKEAGLDWNFLGMIRGDATVDIELTLVPQG